MAGGEGPLASEPPGPGFHRRGCGTLCCSPAASPAPPAATEGGGRRGCEPPVQGSYASSHGGE